MYGKSIFPFLGGMFRLIRSYIHWTPECNFGMFTLRTVPKPTAEARIATNASLTSALAALKAKAPGQAAGLLPHWN